jgi:hypothetical protein
MAFVHRAAAAAAGAHLHPLTTTKCSEAGTTETCAHAVTAASLKGHNQTLMEPDL